MISIYALVVILAVIASITDSLAPLVAGLILAVYAHFLEKN